MGTAEDPTLRFFAMIHVKNQVLGDVFRGTFSDSFRQDCILIVRTSCGQLNARSGIFGLLWLEICAPNDKFAFLGNKC